MIVRDVSKGTFALLNNTNQVSCDQLARLSSQQRHIITFFYRPAAVQSNVKRIGALPRARRKICKLIPIVVAGSSPTSAAETRVAVWIHMTLPEARCRSFRSVSRHYAALNGLRFAVIK